MFLLEEDAKKKWCPLAQIAEVSKFNNREDIAACCASACMMWSWKERKDGLGLTNEGCCGLAK